MFRTVLLTFTPPLLLAAGGCACYQAYELRQSNRMMSDRIPIERLDLVDAKRELARAKADLAQANAELAALKR